MTSTLNDFDPSTNKPSPSEPLSPRREILLAVARYFRETGCASEIDERRGVVTVSAPYSRDIWWIDFVDHESDYLVVLPKGFYFGDKGMKKKSVKVALSDPESFPKMLAFINAKSTYLRGGIGDHRWIAKDTE